MKKIICILLLLFCFINEIKAETLDLCPHAQSSILIEATSKEVLYKDQELEKMYPASTTKIMTMILMFEAINNERIKWDDVLTCSEYAASMGGSQVYLEAREKMSVKELFKAISIASANDACVMIGEYIAGSNEAFVEMMNNKAKSLKLKNTQFKNATGLHDEEHYTCAYDLAMMAAYLLEIGGDTLLEVTSQYDSYIREGEDKFWLVNTNKLLKAYNGCDGLKTGYTKEAGYCIVTTAKRDGLRLIGVVLKEDTPTNRNEDAMKLMDYGYSLYDSYCLFEQGEIIKEIKIHDSNEKLKIYSKEDIRYIKDLSKDDQFHYEINYTDIIAPIKKDSVIGYMVIYRNNINMMNYPLYAYKDVKALSFSEKIMRYFTSFV